MPLNKETQTKHFLFLSVFFLVEKEREIFGYVYLDYFLFHSFGLFFLDEFRNTLTASL